MIAVPAGAPASVVVAMTEGVVAAYDVDGALRWQTILPADAGYRP